MDMKLHTSSDKQDWGTPTQWFNDLHNVFDFTIDVCATPDNAKLPRYWTEKDDALSKNWARERCWCNPPYGKSLPIWSEKVNEEAFFAELIAFLVPVATSTKWFRKLTGLNSHFCFLNKKVKFEAPGIDSNAPFHSVLVVIGSLSVKETAYLNSIGTLMREL